MAAVHGDDDDGGMVSLHIVARKCLDTYLANRRQRWLHNFAGPQDGDAVRKTIRKIIIA